MSVWLHIGKLFLSDMENLTLNLLYINRLQPMTVSGNPILCVCVCVRKPVHADIQKCPYRQNICMNVYVFDIK